MNPWTYSGIGYRRRPTRTVSIGDLPVGSEHPIRVQSMTTPSTKDTRATVDQIVRLVEAGCEIVRLTVPTSADADNLPNIRRELVARKIHVPLVADIHFTPAAAMKAVEHVEKIRINPGNYADKKKFAVIEYSDREYDTELDRIAEVFSPLVVRAKQLGVSMRIGTNHGSLSDRIMNRYGDTPKGMVESALEFVRICESHGYRELVLSMKASNPVVVLQAYRLLATRMTDEKMDYPIHLGVTEAGDGEDGRVKSATGMGPLLEDGIGDTIRVSLTEDPVREIPVARCLVEGFNRRLESGESPATISPKAIELRDPYSYRRRTSHEVAFGPRILGGARPVLVDVPLEGSFADDEALRREIDSHVGVRVPEETRAEVVTVRLGARSERQALSNLRASLEAVAPSVALSATVDGTWLAEVDDAELSDWLASSHRLHLTVDGSAPDAVRSRIETLLGLASDSGTGLLVELGSPGSDVGDTINFAVDLARRDRTGRPSLILALKPDRDTSLLHGTRLLDARLGAEGLTTPIILIDRPADRGADPMLGPAATLGGLLCEGIGDGVQLHAEGSPESRRLAFGILQAARVRITRTEFISCPSCGRTLFDLEETTAKIKARTAHLKGVKIAVMGCVVNGPGEMADADFGYVGWGEDKIALFVGKEMVEKNIPTSEADARLVELIKEHGRWVDPPVSVP